MSSSVEQIKERIGIAEVVGTYLKLEKAGSNLKARCPFHHERTPSFFVSPARGSFYCFGCGAKGDIFSFVEQFEGVDFVGALKILARRAGVVLERENPKVRSERERLFATLDHAAEFFIERLADVPEARVYLAKRGLTEATIKEWRIGFALPEWRVLYDALLKQGFLAEEMFKTGLVKKTDKGFYDVFRGRIIFPLFDGASRVVGFSGRIFGGDETTAKYLNTPETALFNKSEILYGFDRAKQAIRTRDYSIVVEGQMDLLMCHQAGFSNTVAVSGTALTEAHLTQLRRLSNNIIMAFDADDAGVRAAGRSVSLALGMGMTVKIAALKGGKDPAELILENPALWTEAVKNSTHVIDFYINRTLAGKLGERERLAVIQKTILPFVAELQSSVEQSHFVAKIAHQFGIREEALWEDLKKVKPREGGNGAARIGATPPSTPRTGGLPRKIFGIIFWLESPAQKKSGEISPHDLRTRLSKIIGEEASAAQEQAYAPERDQITLEAEIAYFDSKQLPEIIEELFTTFEREHLKESLACALHELRQAENTKDTKRAAELSMKCHELSQRIAKIHT